MPPSVLLRLYSQLSRPRYDFIYTRFLLFFELALCLLIVNRVAYTEIDWEAYMQEVEGWLGGERDYAMIRGGTGPLVYPAGFLYLYGALRWAAGGDGSDVFTAQMIFVGLYIANAAVVLELYTMGMRAKMTNESRKAGKTEEDGRDGTEDTSLNSVHTVWSWRLAMALICLSKRVHSIFVLRLFNDTPAMFLFYVSTLCFMKNSWRLGCAFFSLAVSIKMNILLFAPGLLLLLLQYSPDLGETALCLTICAAIQLVLGAPFLLKFPTSYIKKAFEFDRVFFYKWTVNLKVRGRL